MHGGVPDHHNAAEPRFPGGPPLPPDTGAWCLVHVYLEAAGAPLGLLEKGTEEGAHIQTELKLTSWERGRRGHDPFETEI